LHSVNKTLRNCEFGANRRHCHCDDGWLDSGVPLRGEGLWEGERETHRERGDKTQAFVKANRGNAQHVPSLPCRLRVSAEFATLLYCAVRATPLLVIHTGLTDTDSDTVLAS
jgi:hypothetical protein